MSLPVEVEEVLAGRRRWAVVTGDSVALSGELPEGCVDHCLSDFPYDPQTHSKARSMKLGGSKLEIDFPELVGYGHVADQLRIAKRWVLNFCALGQLGAYAQAAGYLDPEKPGAWKRDGVWVKPDSTPQLTGDRPANGAEGISILHRPGRSRWNARGKRGVWVHGVERDERFSETPKPPALICELLTDFTDPDDLIFDGAAGGGTTGACALRMGRRVILVELRPHQAEICRERLEAEVQGVGLHAARDGQMGLFGGVT